MGDDVEFVRALLDRYKAAETENLKRLNLEDLKDSLEGGMYSLSDEERMEFLREIERELEGTAPTEVEVEGGEEEEVEEEERGTEEEEREERIEAGPEARLIELLVTFKTNPDGLAEALERALPEERREFFADLIRERLEKSAGVEAIDWTTNVAKWQKGCEEAKGIPMYRTRYLGRFKDPEHPGRYMVLGICYSPKERPYKSQWFNNVPLEDVERLERV